MIVFGRFIDITVVNSEDFTMAKLEQTLFAPKTGESLHDNVPAAKLLGKRTHQVPGPDKGKSTMSVTNSFTL